MSADLPATKPVLVRALNVHDMYEPDYFLLPVASCDY
jgi:hypothetical protein